MENKNQAVVILNHGTRHKQAQKDFTDFTSFIRDSLSGSRVEQASMEMSEPNLPDVVGKLYKEGIRKIAVIPFFVFSGIHITQDIPEMIGELKKKYNGLEIVQSNPLMPDRRLSDIVLDRIKEVLA